MNGGLTATCKMRVGKLEEVVRTYEDIGDLWRFMCFARRTWQKSLQRRRTSCWGRRSKLPDIGGVKVVSWNMETKEITRLFSPVCRSEDSHLAAI